MDIRETEYGSVDWIHSAANRNQRRAVVSGTSGSIKWAFLNQTNDYCILGRTLVREVPYPVSVDCTVLSCLIRMKPITSYKAKQSDKMVLKNELCICH